MSVNLSRLAGRKGIENNLFERLTKAGPGFFDESSVLPRQLADEYLVGEATTYGAASFYDYLQPETGTKTALVCNGSACLCAGTQEAVRARLAEFLDSDEIGQITCLGRCHENSAFQFRGRNYSGADIDQAGDLAAGKATASAESYRVESLLDEPLLTGAFSGIDSYYEPFLKALQRPVEDVLAEITDSRLRGRGGAGFPAGTKWASCRAAKGDRKFIVCNADEGDPGAYIDRYLMEQQPHSVLLGMMVAGWICGAETGVIYVRAEYPESVDVLAQAMLDLEKAGLLGENIADSDFTFRLKLVKGAGAYICGEETALLASLEGRRPEVSIRPPYPTVEGLFGCPTVINNVETFACIHAILTLGGKGFAAIGTERSTGPKLVSLDGLFERPGLYEVPMGTPLKTIIDDLGGGFRRPVKALHVGGPLGGLVPRSKLDQLTLDFESFAEAGFLLGHAGTVSIPESMPMIAYLEHLFEFTSAESCGKCFPCRLGAKRGAELLRGARDNDRQIDRALFDDLVETMELGSLCALGGGVPLPVRNALEHFADELAPYFTNGGHQ